MEDIYDLAWSPDSRFVLFGLTDHSVQIWDVANGQRSKTAKEHSHFVQGVAWDPLNVYLATQSSDRTAKVWRVLTKVNGSIALGSINKIGRAPTNYFEASPAAGDGAEEKMHAMFFDETLVSFFRRLAFSPDGSLLFLPTGLVPRSTAEGRGRHALYIATRGQLAGMPGVVIDGFSRGIVAVRPHPRLFRPQPEPAGQPLFALPYRIVYATASQDTVAVFDSTRTTPIAMFNNLHYGTLTDLAWSMDGRHLIATATDGFASMILVAEGDLGEMLPQEEQEGVIAGLREKFAPGAIPTPASQAEPLELMMTLNRDPAGTPTSELDLASPAPPVVNILPVKRKVVPTQLTITRSQLDS